MGYQTLEALLRSVDWGNLLLVVLAAQVFVGSCSGIGRMLTLGDSGALLIRAIGRRRRCKLGQISSQDKSHVAVRTDDNWRKNAIKLAAASIAPSPHVYAYLPAYRERPGARRRQVFRILSSTFSTSRRLLPPQITN